MIFFSFTGLASEKPLNICLILQGGIRVMKLGTAGYKKSQFYKVQLQLYKQVGFTICGLAYTSPKVILTSPKKFLTSRINK